MVYFGKKVFLLRIWISNICLLPKQGVCRKDIDKFLVILKITAYHDLSLTFFHKTWPPEELLNHKEVNYFFMPNFHDVMSNLWWVCRKDMSEMIPKIKFPVTTKRPFSNQKAFFELYPIRCLIKIFWIVLAIKYEKRSLLGWKHLSYVKD